MRYAILLLLLSGCATTEQGMRIVWHRLDGQTTYIYQGVLGETVARKVNGYTKFIDGACHVWAPDPPVKIVNGKREYTNGQWATLGHEIKHCFDGQFHD